MRQDLNPHYTVYIIIALTNSPQPNSSKMQNARIGEVLMETGITRLTRHYMHQHDQCLALANGLPSSRQKHT